MPHFQFRHHPSDDDTGFQRICANGAQSGQQQVALHMHASVLQPRTLSQAELRLEARIPSRLCKFVRYHVHNSPAHLRKLILSSACTCNSSRQLR